MEYHAEQQECAKWPVEKIATRSISLGLCFPRVDSVQLGVDFLQLVTIGSVKVATTRGGGNGGQCLIIQFFFADSSRITDTDNVNDDVIVLRNSCRLRWRHLAAGIIAIGQGDHHAMFDLTALKQSYAEPDGITKCRARAGHAHRSFLQ